MQSLTIKLQQLETIAKSKRTMEEKKLLTKAARLETDWTSEIQELYMKAVLETET